MEKQSTIELLEKYPNNLEAAEMVLRAAADRLWSISADYIQAVDLLDHLRYQLRGDNSQGGAQ